MSRPIWFKTAEASVRELDREVVRRQRTATHRVTRAEVIRDYVNEGLRRDKEARDAAERDQSPDPI